MQIQLDVIFGVMVIITSMSHDWLFLPFAVLQGEKNYSHETLSTTSTSMLFWRHS